MLSRSVQFSLEVPNYDLGTLQVRLVTDKETKKPRGYAFVEYAHTRDMKNAYKQADGRKLDNKRLLADVERGRTVPNWRPRRLGGGVGSSRIGAEGCNSLLGNPDQRSLGGMIIMQIGILRNLGIECGKRTRMKEPVSVRMTGRVIVNLEKGDRKSVV